MEKSPKKLVREVNRKLSRSKRAVFRTKARPDSSAEAYTLLDTKSGAAEFLSLEELRTLARKLGLEP